MAREEEEEKPKAFKVEDRRRFSAEGELRQERHAETPPPAEPPPVTRSHAAEAAAAHTAEAPPMTDNQPNFTAGAQDNYAHGQRELTFVTFVMGLSTQALVHLGEIPEPQSGKFEGDLLAAEQLIDIIAMLQDKTRGNLDSEEAQLVETILFELRMKYVERARQDPH
jgi:hypothetical protein